MSGGRILRSLILGAPGSGKGTISSRLVRDFKLKHLASGDILRNQIAEKTEVGVEAEQYLQKGQLVPDPLIVALISSELTSVKQNWLLDGFPRTVSQAESLSQTQEINLVLNLDVPFDTIRERLENRWIHASSGRVYHTIWNPPKNAGKDDETGEALIQRNDDKPETVTRRLKLYNEMTLPLLDYYRKLGVLQSFHGTESDVIYPQIKDFLEPFVSDFFKK
ncbi:GTP:AMP phosphotransferase AK3, mitochondrial-like [Hydractinia symbiolongicarpus]|uniref:GTP:AMP phosphotransferase AK3, mitochondrial-like n=1 Tax=Hydractinia symbiolongicarpus TaxID=13093 RepID=UPI0025515B29|nr:GTP:AMP phosphotransferase AK3, mitochondrial-like [Hydractinia symbiolongicarpus]